MSKFQALYEKTMKNLRPVINKSKLMKGKKLNESKEDWSSVKNTLPDADVEVVTSNEDFTNFDLCIYDKDGKWLDTDGNEIKVAYWMSIPSKDEMNSCSGDEFSPIRNNDPDFVNPDDVKGYALVRSENGHYMIAQRLEYGRYRGDDKEETCAWFEKGDDNYKRPIAGIVNWFQLP